MAWIRNIPLFAWLVAGTLAVVAVAYGIFGASLFSPGPLRQAREGARELGGIQGHDALSNRCSACHAPSGSTDTMESRCLACHTDIRGQIEGRTNFHGRIAGGYNCRMCHTEHRGSDAEISDFSLFDHAATAFPLVGRHERTRCAECHKDNRFQGTPTSCVACHAEPEIHRGKFGVTCASCHSTDSWKGAIVPRDALADFDHAKTHFPLTGRHAATRCAECHKDNRFQGTPTSCVACHAEPEIHRGKFGVTCASCHSTDSWKGATLPRDLHPFPTNHGRGRKPNECATCHTNPGTYRTYTCFGCHEHTLDRTVRQHRRMPPEQLAQCAHCHPRGREHDDEDREGRHERSRERRERPEGDSRFLPPDHHVVPNAPERPGDSIHDPLSILIPRLARLLENEPHGASEDTAFPPPTHLATPPGHP